MEAYLFWASQHPDMAVAVAASGAVAAFGAVAASVAVAVDVGTVD